MFVKVLYDNRGRRGFKTGAGFSCLVDGKILFDTGEDARSLLENMSRMKVSMGKIKAVVVSHDHWAHTGGLWGILKKKKSIKVYACPKFGDEFKTCVKELKGDLVLTEEFTEIDKNVFVTGEIGASYKGKYMSEQALVIKGDKGISVITGCAHPGVARIVKNAKRRFEEEKLYMVLGGFHLGGLERAKVDRLISDFREMGVKKIGPAHCSGDMAIRVIKGQYGRNFAQVGAGSIVEV
ncbi:MAG: MBL fold metallo-hydrolase [Candidatus Omnitrophota bacterium]